MHPTSDLKYKISIYRTKREIDRNTIITEVSTKLVVRDRTSRQKYNKEIVHSKNMLGHMELRLIQRIWPSSSRMHILIGCTWNILQDRLCLGHKINVNKFCKNPFLLLLFSMIQFCGFRYSLFPFFLPICFPSHYFPHIITVV